MDINNKLISAFSASLFMRTAFAAIGHPRRVVLKAQEHGRDIHIRLAFNNPFKKIIWKKVEILKSLLNLTGTLKRHALLNTHIFFAQPSHPKYRVLLLYVEGHTLIDYRKNIFTPLLKILNIHPNYQIK